MTVRVLLADDQSLVRAGLRSLLEQDPDIQVVGEAGDGAHAVALARQLRPDVVLMDVRMPGVDGLAATEQLAADPELAAVRVVVLTTYQLDEYLFRALAVGASGFLLKTIEPADLRRAVHVVADGGALLDPAVTRRVIEQFGGARGAVPARERLRAAQLTDRELEVLRLVADGLSNDEIGRALYISTMTAKTHVNRAMAKLGARDRAQLVVVAYQAGLAG